MKIKALVSKKAIHYKEYEIDLDEIIDFYEEWMRSAYDDSEIPEVIAECKDFRENRHLKTIDEIQNWIFSEWIDATFEFLEEQKIKNEHYEYIDSFDEEVISITLK